MNEIIMKENKWGFEVGDIVKYIGHNNELEFRGEFGERLYAEHLIDNGSGVTFDFIESKYTGRYWTVMEYETWTLVRKANKPQREFKKGDKVRFIVKKTHLNQAGITEQIDMNKVYTVLSVGLYRWNIDEEPSPVLDLPSYSGYVCPKNLELVEDEEQVDTLIPFSTIKVAESWSGRLDKWNGDYNDNVESPTTIKKGQNIMSKLTNFVKDSFLSKEEKLMRKHGLKDSCGDYTSEARELAIQKLMSECDSYFIKVVKDMEAEEKANK